jgi:hypothetical protein
MVWVVIVGGVVAVLAVVAWFTLTRQHPEGADRHLEDHHIDDQPHVDAAGRGTGSPGVVDRPAGPDAESMAPDPMTDPARPVRRRTSGTPD